MSVEGVESLGTGLFLKGGESLFPRKGKDYGKKKGKMSTSSSFRRTFRRREER